jgi:uncharacterized OsmC-like protein
MNGQEVPEDVQLWVERESATAFHGHNRRGAEVLIGPHTNDAAGGTPGTFTPGELLEIALAGCAALSAEAPLTRRIGDTPRIVTVDGDYDSAENRLTHMNETLLVDLSGLTEEDRAKVRTIVERAIDTQCTVGRTLKAGTTIDFAVSDK